ncbi:hypothetical protein IW256_000417 [Actinomadura viridis]|uniref:Uncharacterized protein n=1 Tax=Actinomadura viridis TaxID=58110 RepID=A0A931DCF7_9ACTN|nr:hypothetical protein [Actinomadura viridis]
MHICRTYGFHQRHLHKNPNGYRGIGLHLDAPVAE